MKTSRSKTSGKGKDAALGGEMFESCKSCWKVRQSSTVETRGETTILRRYNRLDRFTSTYRLPLCRIADSISIRRDLDLFGHSILRHIGNGKSMFSRRSTAAFAIWLLAASASAADPQLVLKLKELGKAVDNVTINISNAESDADAQLIAKVTQETFANNMTFESPDISIQASKGNCLFTIKTAEWQLWSQAQNGKIVNHGAKIN